MSTEQLPLRRSVIFEPTPGTASRDTTSEGTIDSDVGCLYCSARHSGPSPSIALDTCVRPSSDTTRIFHDRESDEISVADSEITEAVDIALEEAAAEATMLSHISECKSPHVDDSTYDAGSRDKANAVCSDSETLEHREYNGSGTPRYQRRRVTPSRSK
ncbi:unnamed protein product [Dicrocoelium dendriticum]|nr:unnamed protein product [Dicrocoelium dendriticum]